MALYDKYDDYKIYNLENIIYNKEKDINKIYKKFDDYDLKNIYSSPKSRNQGSSLYSGLSSFLSQLNQPSPQATTPINWGTQRQTNTQNAYVQPTQEEVERVIEALHITERLPADQQRQLIEATREIRYFFDGQIRSRFGATQHFNAIRCLNNPETTDVTGVLSLPRTQLAGEEFFALNRFMANYPDIADIQWWSVYRDGSWRLDTWNPEGEHLDTGMNGWGNLVGSVLKLNGRVLTPNEMIAFYRTLRLRNERGFLSERAFENLRTLLTSVSRGERLPSRYDEQLETAHDLGLVGSDGRSLTYQGTSMIVPVTARQRKARQLTETDESVRRIIVPTIFN